MKQLSKFWFLIVFGLFLNSLNSCSKEEELENFPIPGEPDSTGYIELNFNFTGNGSELEFNKDFTDPLNRQINVSRLQFYLSNVFANQNLSSFEIEDVALITKFADGSSDPDVIQTSIVAELATGHYESIKMGIGLDQATNATNPNDPDLSIDDPLSSDRNTHWGQWSKYKFIMVEGEVDTSNSGSANTIYSYHTGFDEMYRQKEFSKDFHIHHKDTTRIDFTLEYNEIFFGSDTLDMRLDRTWHGTDTTYLEPAKVISDNFKKALKIL